MCPELRRIALSIAVAVTGAAAGAADPPDSSLNATTGSIETADSTWTDSNYDIRHVINPGGGAPLQVTTLTSDPADDLGPRMLIRPSTGAVWVAWWRDLAVDAVILRKRSEATGSWGPEQVLSDPAQGSRRPKLAFDGSAPWVAYEADAPGGGTAVEIQVIEDEPAPFGARTIVAITPNTGDLDIVLHAEAGRLWVTWLNGSSEIGWSWLDRAAGGWSAPAFEPYVGESVASARARVRVRVFAN